MLFQFSHAVTVEWARVCLAYVIAAKMQGNVFAVWPNQHKTEWVSFHLLISSIVILSSLEPQ